MKTLLAVFLLVLTSCATEDLDKKRYWAWYDTLTAEQQAVEDQRKHERQLGAIQAFGMMNMGRGTGLTYTPSPIIRPPVSDPMPVYQPRQRLNCTSNQIGYQTYTNCY